MKYIITIIIILVASHAYATTNLIYAGQPISTQAVLVLTNQGYIVGYSEEQKCPLWVCYRIDNVTNLTAPPRPGSFRVDKRTASKVKPSDYTNTGYDRGHLAPSYGIGLMWGAEAQRETFLMSNVIPQDPALNRGPWKKLELLVAKKWSKHSTRLWIITGPIFNRAHTNHINGIKLPGGSYKILLNEGERLSVLAFGIPQNVNVRDEPEQFLLNVDAIETLTGLDFFHELPDELENRIEKGLW